MAIARLAAGIGYRSALLMVVRARLAPAAIAAKLLPERSISALMPGRSTVSPAVVC